MKQRLMNDLKEAMRNKDTIRKNTIQLVRAVILQQEKDKKKELTNAEIIDIIAKQIKDRDKTIGMVMTDPLASEDFIKRTNAEIEVLKEYMPPMLTENEIRELIAGVAATLNITDKKQMGQLIKAVKALAIGVDGKLISDLVKEYLK